MKQQTLKKLISSEVAILLVLLLLCVVVSIITPSFATPTNILNLLQRTASTGVVAIGMTFVIATSGIDLSVGGQVTLIGILAAYAFESGMSIPVVVLMIFALGIAFGAFNGLFIAKLKFPAFMVTLSLQLITYGFSLYLTTGRSILINCEGYDFWGLGRVAGIPVPIIIFIVVTVLGLVIMKKFTIGRKILAVGSNEKGAWYAGINVVKTTFIANILHHIKQLLWRLHPSNQP